MPSYVTFFDRDDPVSQGFRDNLYWWSKVIVFFLYSEHKVIFIKLKIQSCIQDYETMPYAGSGEDLLDFQKLTKERVADLEKDIKESLLEKCLQKSSHFDKSRAKIPLFMGVPLILKGFIRIYNLYKMKLTD